MVAWLHSYIVAWLHSYMAVSGGMVGTARAAGRKENLQGQEVDN